MGLPRASKRAIQEIRMELYETLCRQVREVEDDMKKAVGGNKAAGTRVRKAMQDIKDTAQQIRGKVLELRGSEAAGEGEE